MRLRNMLKICLVFWKSEPQYAYKRYAYKKKHVTAKFGQNLCLLYRGCPLYGMSVLERFHCRTFMSHLRSLYTKKSPYQNLLT